MIPPQAFAELLAGLPEAGPRQLGGGSAGGRGRPGVGRRRGEVVSGAVWQGPAEAHGSALTASLPNLVFIEPRSNYLKP